MMGWVIMVAMALGVVAALWPFLRRDMAALQFLGAALLLALPGYSWQGHPGRAGSPKAPPTREEVPENAFAALRPELLGQFDRAGAWLTLAEGYQARGDTQAGVDIVRRAIELNPNDADLWVGLGNALVMHADGLMSPAAELAFNRASQIAPDHPGPRFFYGLALAQGGRFDEAEQVWRQLLASAPPSANWRSAIEAQLDMLARVRSAQPAGPAPAMR
jgi:cytochrome c-type biogenesis protein CcmH